MSVILFIKYPNYKKANLFFQYAFLDFFYLVFLLNFIFIFFVLKNFKNGCFFIFYFIFFSKNLLVFCSFFHELFFCRKIGDGLKQKRKKEYDTYEGVKTKNMNYQNNVIDSSSQEMFYDANEGFIKGNIEKSIYDPYKNYVPVEPKVNTDREALLLFIQKSGFAAHDLGLYLDTHPNAKAALDLRNFYLKQYNNAMNRYQKQFGALGMNDENLNETPFQWVQSPWPWEGK